MSDRIEALLDRVFERAKPGDALIVVRYDDGEEIDIYRTEAGATFYHRGWYPVMGGYNIEEPLTVEEARAKLRPFCSNTEYFAQVESRFPP